MIYNIYIYTCNSSYTVSIYILYCSLGIFDLEIFSYNSNCSKFKQVNIFPP